MKKLLLLLGVCAYLSAMENASDHLYYNAFNMSVVDQFNVARHAPLMIMIDEYNSETVNQKPGLLPCTFALVELINIKTFPILLTTHLLSNLLVRIITNPTNQVSVDLKSEMGEFNLDDWEIAKIKNSKFVLMVPKTFLKIFGRNPGFNSDIFIQASALGQFLQRYPEDERVSKLIEILNTHEEENPRFNIASFKNVFEPNTNIWDIRLLGHGTSNRNPPVIANLLPNQLNALLSFFDRTLSVGTFFVESCMAGGKNRTLLETNTDGISLKHNFILILGSIGNSSIGLHQEGTRESLINFFNYAADRRDKGGSLNTLLKKVAIVSPSPESQHGVQNIPQVWLPGGIGFQTFNIDQSILSLNSVLLKKYQEDKKPLMIQNKVAVLVYPEFIDIPITVFPTRKQTTIFTWHNHPLFFEANFITKSQKEITRVFSQLGNENILPQFFLKRTVNPNLYQYPQFISMLTEENNHRFSEITVATDFNGQQIATGILQFLRDSFLDMQLTYSPHAFRIDKLTGNNDISLMLASTRILNQSKPHPLEEILKDYVNKQITLEKVFALYDPSGETTVIAFSFNNTAWYINISLSNPQKNEWWNFSKAPGTFQDYLAEYDKKLPTKLSSSQKSIADSLKQKQTDIAQKKAAEEREKLRARL